MLSTTTMNLQKEPGEEESMRGRQITTDAMSNDPEAGTTRLDEWCLSMYHAALKGDWPAAEANLKLKENAVCAKITERDETALHIAALAKRVPFVQNLVELMNNADDLKNVTDKYQNTAFYHAAASGMVEIAMTMYAKNDELPLIRGSGNKTPIQLAALMGHRDMVSYLCKVTPFKNLEKEDYIELLRTTIHNDIYDISVKIWNKIEQSIDVTDWKEKYFLELAETVLCELAKKPSAFGTGESLFGIIPEKLLCLYSKRRKIARKLRKFLEDMWPEYLRMKDMNAFKSSIIFDAAKVGNIEFLIVLISKYPDLIWCKDENNCTIFHIALLHRHESIFNLIFEFGAIKDLIAYLKDKDNNNMLHMAGKLPPTDRLNIVSGAALQLQRELLWFKGLVDHKIVPPSSINERNKETQEELNSTEQESLLENNEMLDADTTKSCVLVGQLIAKAISATGGQAAKNREGGKIPGELFSKEHKLLLENGEKWMKDTASSCMLVATLIATVVFAAAFTVPGGNNGDTGSPLLFERKWFTVFIVSDAVALFCSAISIIMFLSVLISRYRENDFLHMLPCKLMLGLGALFASIVTMVLAFVAALFLLYRSKIRWELILVAVFAFAPVLLYLLTNCKLWFEIFCSTILYRSPIRRGRTRLFK